MNLNFFHGFSSTAEAEVFNDSVLMYCSKRHAYKFSGYKARCQLCAIDRTKHKNRSYRLNKNGEYM